jgi:TP901-1 family phage major tail protein
MAMNGTDLLILANTGTPGVPAYSIVGSQRDATLEESTDTIDISSKDSRAQRVLPGRYSGTISLDALYVPNDAAFQALKNANRDGEMILVAREEAGVVIETVEAKIDSISEAFPDQAEATISISFTIDGFWNEVGS